MLISKEKIKAHIDKRIAISESGEAKTLSHNEVKGRISKW